MSTRARARTHTHTHTHSSVLRCMPLITHILCYSEVWGPSEPQNHVSSSPASTPSFCVIEGKSFTSLKLGTVHCSQDTQDHFLIPIGIMMCRHGCVDVYTHVHTHTYTHFPHPQYMRVDAMATWSQTRDNSSLIIKSSNTRWAKFLSLSLHFRVHLLSSNM